MAEGDTPVLAAKAFIAACMLCWGVIPSAPNWVSELRAFSEGLFFSRSFPDDPPEELPSAECGDISGLLLPKLGCIPASDALLALTLVEFFPPDISPEPLPSPMPWPCIEEEEDPPPPDFFPEDPPEPEPEAAAATACMARSSLWRVTGS